MTGKVTALSLSKSHEFSKQNQSQINLLKGLGVEGDCHSGEKVKHRSRVAQDPTQPNLRQVHLIHSELFDELNEKGFEVKPGEIGENITTQGINLLDLPTNTILEIGEYARVQITGLRNPCSQLDAFQKGLMKAVLDKDENDNLIRKSGIMGIVLEGGIVTLGAAINVILPEEPHQKLERV